MRSQVLTLPSWKAGRSSKADLRSRSDESDRILNYGATKTRNVCEMIPFVENDRAIRKNIQTRKMTLKDYTKMLVAFTISGLSLY